MKCTSCNKSFSPEKMYVCKSCGACFCEDCVKNNQNSCLKCGTFLDRLIKKCRFSWQKRAFHVKHCRFWRGFLLSFYIGIRRIFCLFFAVFYYKTR